MKYLILSFILIGVVSAAPASDQCEEGKVTVKNGFWYNCTTHPRLGTYEEPKGCVVVGPLGTDLNVEFGVETEMNGELHLYGFVINCLMQNNMLMTRLTGCWSYDITKNENIRVLPGADTKVSPHNGQQKLTFACMKGETGTLSYKITS